MFHNKSESFQQLEAVVKALQTGAWPATTLLLSNQVLATADATKRFEAYLALFVEEAKANDAAKSARLALEAVRSAAQGDLEALKKAVQAAFGERSPKVATFGFEPAKVRKALTGEERALKAARARATRELRGTRGKRQKEALVAKEVHFRVDGAENGAARVTVLPATPAPPGASPGPTPSAAPGSDRRIA